METRQVALLLVPTSLLVRSAEGRLEGEGVGEAPMGIYVCQGTRFSRSLPRAEEMSTAWASERRSFSVHPAPRSKDQRLPARSSGYLPDVPKGEVHVLPSDDGWRIEVDDEERARSIHPTQAEAIAKARKIARGSERELCIHGRDGQIRDRLYRADRDGPRNLAVSLLTRNPLQTWKAWALAAVALVGGAITLGWIFRERSD
jgi:hypothetical protein